MRCFKRSLSCCSGDKLLTTILIWNCWKAWSWKISVVVFFVMLFVCSTENLKDEMIQKLASLYPWYAFWICITLPFCVCFVKEEISGKFVSVNFPWSTIFSLISFRKKQRNFKKFKALVNNLILLDTNSCNFSLTFYWNVVDNNMTIIEEQWSINRRSCINRVYHVVQLIRS